MEWVLARLKEGSTWRGLIVLLSVAGVAVSPEQAQAITALGLSLVALIEVFRKG